VSRALEHARSLLAPEGVLLLYEVTTHLAWFEMSIAMIEGWQHHVDDLRGETPLLSPAQWESTLRDHGFQRVASYPPANSAAAVLGHHVVLASAPDVVSSSSTIAAATPAAPSVESSASQTPSAPATPLAPTAGSGSLYDRLVALTVGERVEVLRELVQRQVARVMRLRPSAPLPSTSDRLMSIGMDSLMAVELRKMLSKELDEAITLPSTLIFDYPTIGAIVDLILASLGLNEPVTPTDVAPDAPAESAAAAIADLSEAEVEAMLLEQLKGM
jgi:acyl carrier protein